MYPKSFQEYWIGKGVDFKSLWDSYNFGKDEFESKFNKSEFLVLKIKFRGPAPNYPLFDLEVMYKTLKGFYHSYKENCLSEDQYQESNPLYLYSIERGSAEWSFLTEVPYAVGFVFTIYYAYLKTVKIKTDIEKNKLDNFVKKQEIFKSFSNNPEEIERYRKFIDSLPSDVKSAIDSITPNIDSISVEQEQKPKTMFGSLLSKTKKVLKFENHSDAVSDVRQNEKGPRKLE